MATSSARLQRFSELERICVPVSVFITASANGHGPTWQPSSHGGVAS